MRSNASFFPSGMASDSSSFPRRRSVWKMPSAGGHVPTQTDAPASARAFAIANPKPPSSATPATNARLPVRSIDSMGSPLQKMRELVIDRVREARDPPSDGCEEKEEEGREREAEDGDEDEDEGEGESEEEKEEDLRQ